MNHRFENRVKITNDDLTEIQRLLAVFDYITFNSYGDMLAVVECDLPYVGKFVLSYFVRGNHVATWRHHEKGWIWGGELDIPMPETKAALESWLKGKMV